MTICGFLQFRACIGGNHGYIDSMRFALRYNDNGRLVRTAWQTTMSRVLDMADFYRSEGCEIVSILYKDCRE